jgi:dTMP kinase
MVQGQQPLFLVLEGPDGSGTTTQTAALGGALRRRGLDVLTTAEPSDGPIGRLARAHVRREIALGPLAAAHVFTADRADHLEREIRPALAQGRVVICDRYLLSTLAYQGAEGIDRTWVLAASEGFDVPDLTVFLQVSEPLRAGRLERRGTKERYEDRDFAEALQASYEDSIALLAALGHRVEVVDGGLAADEVTGAILGLVDASPAGSVPL